MLFFTAGSVILTALISIIILVGTTTEETE